MSTVVVFGGGGSSVGDWCGDQARLFELLPNPPLTTGQVDLLKADNVASGTLPGLRELKIQPKTVEEAVPTYIGLRANLG